MRWYDGETSMNAYEYSEVDEIKKIAEDTEVSFTEAALAVIASHLEQIDQNIRYEQDKKEQRGEL